MSDTCYHCAMASGQTTPARGWYLVAGRRDTTDHPEVEFDDGFHAHAVPLCGDCAGELTTRRNPLTRDAAEEALARAQRLSLAEGLTTETALSRADARAIIV